MKPELKPRRRYVIDWEKAKPKPRSQWYLDHGFDAVKAGELPEPQPLDPEKMDRDQ